MISAGESAASSSQGLKGDERERERERERPYSSAEEVSAAVQRYRAQVNPPSRTKRRLIVCHAFTLIAAFSLAAESIFFFVWQRQLQLERMRGEEGEKGGKRRESCEGQPSKVISMSLYGSGENFIEGAVANAARVKDVYPDGWALRVYSSSGAEAAARIRAEGAEVVEMPPPEGIYGMFWRFLAASDPCVKYAIFRDTDSLVISLNPPTLHPLTASSLVRHMTPEHSPAKQSTVHHSTNVDLHPRND